MRGGSREETGKLWAAVESALAPPVAAVSAGDMLAGARRGIDHGAL